MTPPYTTKRIDHLGLVAGMCKELNLAQQIDNILPDKRDDKCLSYGQLVVAMILNGLGFAGRTLHMYPEYFEDKPIERLIGQGIEASNINDDALGRCLDQLYESGVSKVYQCLGENVIKHLGLPCEGLNLDSTSMHVDGEYDDFGVDANAIKITRGYSRDHRPELNQVVLNLITENQAGIPVYMQPASGNTNDLEGFKKIVKQHISSLKAAQQCQYFIGDSALYVAETIRDLNEQGMKFISRAPQKLKQVKVLISQQHELPFKELEKGYSACWHDVEYGDVKQRWLLVRSEQAAKRETYTFDKNMQKNTTASLKSFKKLCQQNFACQADAQSALDKWETQQDYITVNDRQIKRHAIYKGRGRPKTQEEPLRYAYSITGALSSSLSKRAWGLSQKGMFVLATNDIKGDLTMEKMLSLYKSQQRVEKGFRFLKSPDFLVSSLYLKKPERIEALLMVMTCCLMIYAALEHKIRAELVSQSAYFPDMKYKPAQNPTVRWVFQCFQGIDLLTLGSKEQLVLNLVERQRVVLNCLGSKYWEIYS